MHNVLISSPFCDNKALFSVCRALHFVCFLRSLVWWLLAFVCCSLAVVCWLPGCVRWLLGVVCCVLAMVCPALAFV